MNRHNNVRKHLILNNMAKFVYEKYFEMNFQAK